jgi:hypothetical protein
VKTTEVTNPIRIFANKFIAVDKCVFCGCDVTEKSFRDERSKREYKISGICQKCQDTIFDKA